MLRLSSFAVLALALTLAACDASDSDIEPISFRPLLNSDAFVTAEPERQQYPSVTDRALTSQSRVVVFRSTFDVETFTDTYTVSEPFPDIDFETESVVGYFLRDNRGDAFVDIQRIELHGEDKIVLFSDFGGVGVSAYEPASRFVVQLVAVPRLEAPGYAFESYNIDRL